MKGDTEVPKDAVTEPDRYEIPSASHQEDLKLGWGILDNVLKFIKHILNLF